MADNSTPTTTSIPLKSQRLAESSYHSPYSHAGAPTPHPNDDPYAPLRGRALATLEAMGYGPKTMVERGVVWAEDQDPFGHVMNSQYSHFLSTCFHRVMESFDQFLSKEEFDDMIHARTVIPVLRKYEVDFRRQVKYPDSLIAAHREEGIEPTRNNATVSLFSLKQQAIVAEAKGCVTFIDVKTNRPVDIRTLGGGWTALFEAFTKEAQEAKELKEKWDAERAKEKAAKIPHI
ncbi:hypothetical protein K449DRAFT_381017 [Hypoxylon sp. EC38]|nr:hypothetical protein K449DRAFT_381017 [Hypoxylon sp. EC38]